MGQAVAGAATSGGGLTAIQVAAALRVVAASHVLKQPSDGKKRAGALSTPSSHHDSPVATTLSTAEGATKGPEVAAQAKTSLRSDTARYSPPQNDAVNRTYALDEEDCEATTAFTVRVPAENGVEVQVVEYAPEVFALIREGQGVDAKSFAEDWDLPEERLRLELGEGRSQALFLKSKSMEFMCKTIAQDEVSVLLQVLCRYARHIAAQPNSLLMRFYLLLKVTVDKEFGFILCFNDVFGAATALHEKWDIKGRLPKPGKYQYFPHLIRPASAPDPFLIDTPVNRESIAPEDKKSSLGPHQCNGEPVIISGDTDVEKVPTLHDKDLTRLFWLPRATRRILVRQLMDDYSFLADCGLMDYSLLIGVCYRENKRSRSGRRYVVSTMKMSSPPGVERVERVERRPGSLKSNGHLENHPAHGGATPCFADGVNSLYDQETYYIGIIDMLTTYSAKKKAANFFKSFLWKEKTLSTIPPPAYKERIASFTKYIIPNVEITTEPI